MLKYLPHEVARCRSRKQNLHPRASWNDPCSGRPRTTLPERLAQHNRILGTKVFRAESRVCQVRGGLCEPNRKKAHREVLQVRQNAQRSLAVMEEAGSSPGVIQIAKQLIFRETPNRCGTMPCVPTEILQQDEVKRTTAGQRLFCEPRRKCTLCVYTN